LVSFWLFLCLVLVGFGGVRFFACFLEFSSIFVLFLWVFFEGDLNTCVSLFIFWLFGLFGFAGGMFDTLSSVLTRVYFR